MLLVTPPPTGAAGNAWAGICVGLGTIMKGVLSIVVVCPVSPGGAFATGIFVELEIMMYG
jgi:hypothetical protein